MVVANGRDGVITQTQQAEGTTIKISPIDTVTITVPIRGTRPLILNRLSEKAKHELLFPSERKTAADKASTLKHEPIPEFLASPYVTRRDNDPTLLAMPAGAFKGAMMQTALRLPGAKKTEIGQLCQVNGDLVPIYGIPELFIAAVRSADMNHTPDLRSRCIVPEWATVISVTFAIPLLNDVSMINLLAAAGQICGVGDWRPEKGKGTYGQFALTNAEEDEHFQGIVATGGRAAQIAAMDAAMPYDDDTREELEWWTAQLKARGKTKQQQERVLRWNRLPNSH